MIFRCFVLFLEIVAVGILVRSSFFFFTMRFCFWGIGFWCFDGMLFILFFFGREFLGYLFLVLFGFLGAF